MLKLYYKWRLRAAYLHWRSIGLDMDCGLKMARVFKPGEFLRTEERCMKYAKILRAMGDDVPLVPGEDSDWNG
jgi:hypothetical protein